MKIVFWITVGLILYTYAIYPLLLVFLAGLRQLWTDVAFAIRRTERRSRALAQFSPTVSLIFSAYNEEKVIAGKMRNCAELDYPPERLEILVGCDGCTDRTADLARAANLANARVFEYPERAGKASVINRLMEEASGEIVVFSDASTEVEPKAVHCLLQHFSDSRVGCVSGEVRLRRGCAGPTTEGLYWRYEVVLRSMETRLNLLVGASGCLYAIRRELFAPVPKHGINEDFLIPLFIRAKGYRQVYAPQAVGYEEAASVYQDFHRHVRIGAGNFHALRFTRHLLSPTSGPVAFAYWSHKVLRWLVPFALPVVFVSALAQANEPFYALASAVGATVVLLAFIGYRLELKDKHHAFFTIPYSFLSMNLALLLGFVRFVNGSQGAVWQRSARRGGVL